MNTKTSELTGAALDWAVAKCEGMEGHYLANPYTYSTNWIFGGPIIDRERFSRMTLNMLGGYTVSTKTIDLGPDGDEDEAIIRWVHGVGDTLLIAAMRCYVASKLGDTVDIHEIKGTQ